MSGAFVSTASKGGFASPAGLVTLGVWVYKGCPCRIYRNIAGKNTRLSVQTY